MGKGKEYIECTDSMCDEPTKRIVRGALERVDGPDSPLEIVHKYDCENMACPRKLIMERARLEQERKEDVRKMRKKICIAVIAGAIAGIAGFMAAKMIKARVRG